MRIAIAGWNARRIGGVEDYLSLLMPALHGAGMSIAFWHETDAPADRDRIEVPRGVLDVCVEERGIDAAIAALTDWRPDVIYAHGFTSSDVERRLIGIAPSVFFVHNYPGMCISGGKTWTRPVPTPCDRAFGWACLAHYFPHGCGGRSPVTMWRQFRKQSDQLESLRRYAAIVTHTAHMQAEAARHGLKAEVIPFPVEAEAGQRTSAAAGAWRLLYAGRMDYLKGGRVLLDALPEAASALRASLQVTLAGDGPDRAEWETRAREIRSPQLTIDFAGWVSQARVNALMRETDLLVVPSLWPEPFGSIGPLAARHGVPAAAFDVGGVSAWLSDGKTGHLAPANPPSARGLADAIVRCLKDRSHYAALSAGARTAADRFTMNQHLPALVAVFERAHWKSA
jgi:glycosyltransferase involved in cell wall biosynthesis